MLNTSKQTKNAAKPTKKDVEHKGPGSDSEDSDDSNYEFGLQSDCSGSSFDRLSIISGDLHVVTQNGVPTNDEEGGATDDERCVFWSKV